MRRTWRLGLSLLIVLGLATLLLSMGGRRATAQQDSAEQKLWGIYWTVEQGFTSTLEMKNNLPLDHLTVRISLYFASGEEYPLAPVQLGPRQTATIGLNALMDSLPKAVAARAGKEGTLEVEYEAPTPSALMGSLSVLNSKWHTAWNFFLYPRLLDAPKAPVRGLFWFDHKDVDGFVALQNVSDERVDLTPRFQIGGQTYPLLTVHLAPDQGMKLDLRRELRRLDLDEATAGGIELVYDGPSDAVKAHGVLFDRKGFSAEIDFTRYESLEEKQTLSLRTPRFAVGSADRELGLPPKTIFEPEVALHNFHETPLDVNLAVGYPDGETTKQLDIPLTIPPGDTRVLQLHPYLKDVLPERISWASLEVSYSDSETGLAAAMVSVSKDGVHSIRSVLNWVLGSNREGWYWRADADHNTLVSILNTDNEAARVTISLDYYVDGVKHTYALPERTLAPRATSVVDIAGTIKAGLPDGSGEIIPPSITSGGYHVRKVGFHLDKTLTTEALVFDRQTNSFLTFYNTACCYTTPRVIPSSFLGPVGPIGNTQVQGLNYCTSQWEDLTFSSTLSSSPTSIVTVDQSTAAVTGVSPGSGSVTPDLFYPKQKTVSTCVTGHYIPTQPASVDPAVSFGTLTAVGKNYTNTIHVTLSPSPSSVSVTLTLSTTSGSGSAQFSSNNSTTLTISQTADVTIKGITESSTANNILLRATGTDSGFTLATTNFTVLLVTLSLRTSGTVSSENTAINSYSTRQGTTSLGTLLNSSGEWINGVEIVATVTPSNFGQAVTLVRSVTFRTYVDGSLDQSVNGQEDTSGSPFRDDTITATGHVYDTDTPLIGTLPSRPVGTIYRVRSNFTQWAVVGGTSTTAGTRVSADLQWFSRLSVVKAIPNNTLDTTYQGDNTAGTGTTNLSENLQ